MGTLVSFLRSIPERKQELDTGIPHVRGGPTTIALSEDSLVGGFSKRRAEMLAGQN